MDAPDKLWIVREKRNREGVLTDCFVEAPRAEGMAYGLEVLGDDYTGYGDVQGKLAHCRMIVQWANSAEAVARLVKAAEAVYNHRYGSGAPMYAGGYYELLAALDAVKEAGK